MGMAEQHGGFAPLTSSFSKNALTERITAIMKAKPLTAFGMGAGLMLAAAVAVVFATSAPARQQKAVAESVQPGGIRPLVGDVQAGITAQAGTAVQAGTDGWWNGYTKAEYDALLAEANTLTGDERLAKMEEAEKILIQEDGVIAPTFFQTRSWVAKSDVRGIIRNGCGLRVDYKYAYIVEE